MGAALLTRDSAAAPVSPEQDAEVLNFALLVEMLQARFYERALADGKLTGELKTYAEVVGSHEREHRDFILGILGSAARKEPEFDFGETTRDRDLFVKTAIALEDTGLAAYNGQAGNLTPATLAAAAKIVSVEARHAGWIRDIAGLNPAPDAVDAPISADQASKALADTGFIVNP
jgi:rubrerythrin